MKILTGYNNSNTSFQSFTVSYNAEKSLSRLPVGFLAKIIKLGKYFEKTEYIDIELLSDLRFRIKEKGKFFEAFSEPFTVNKPNNNIIKVSGTYDWINNDKNSVCNKYIVYSSAEEAIKGYERITTETSKIDTIAAIANEMEKSLLIEAGKNQPPTQQNIMSLHKKIMNKFGGIVKE